jgi:PTS system nitrogen regulatory IIA component
LNKRNYLINFYVINNYNFGFSKTIEINDFTPGEGMKEKKLLTPKEVAELFDLPLVTIQRWEHQGKIPFKIIHNQKCYQKKEILNWARSHDFIIKSNREQKSIKSIKLLTHSIRRGGIYYNVGGTDIYSAFEKSLNLLKFIDPADKEMVLNELLNREEMTSTGIGNGIAIPHTRNRIELKIQEIFVPVFFLKESIEFRAIDTMPVNIFFMIFTTNTGEHLKILSKISFILQNEDVIHCLQNKNKRDCLLPIISNIEDKI